MRRLLLLLFLCTLFSSCREIVEQEADEKLVLAEAALHEERWDAADELFHEALLLDPERVEAWIGRGMTLTRLGEKEGARMHYEEALTLCERQLQTAGADSGPIIRRQIMLLVLLNRSNEAAVLAREASDTHPDQEVAHPLPQLIEELERDFGDMILPVDDEDNAPVLTDDTPHSSSQKS